nr:serine/threonine-protein phosphatase 7 long form like [Quercus suber]
MLCLQEVPGVLTCHHQEKGLLEGVLDPQIATYITYVGLDGLLHVPNIDLDHALITTLVERWQPETHSFHLPHSEITITLQGMDVIMGVPVDGLPVVWDLPPSTTQTTFPPTEILKGPSKASDQGQGVEVAKGKGIKPLAGANGSEAALQLKDAAPKVKDAALKAKEADPKSKESSQPILQLGNKANPFPPAKA